MEISVKTNGKKITIYLIDGEPNGPKTAELSNWVGKAIVIPRNRLKELKDRPELNKPAIYFLVGKENEGELLPKSYIGEAENVWNRLYDHENKKEFWHTAIAFESKDNNLTKAHVKYLESRCLDLAINAKRFKLENNTESKLPTLPEADEAEMEEFLNNLKLLLSALGYPILQEVISKKDENKSDPLFICKGNGAVATGRMTSDGFVVYKDSTLSTKLNKAVIDKNTKIIDNLIDNKILKIVDKEFNIFINDYIFNSPSAASNIVTGNSTNGWKYWKTEKGKTLEEVYKK
jgi:hypothetical protein